MQIKQLWRGVIFVIPFALGACSGEGHQDQFPFDGSLVDGGIFDGGFEGIQTNLPALYVNENPPPPISGGTLEISPNNQLAVIADPDRDRVHVVDLETRTTRGTLKVPGTEPARLAIQDDRAYIALRRTGQLLVINTIDVSEVARIDVCAAPRGVAFDTRNQRIHVACSGGELVSINPEDNQIARRVFLDRDLRDVVVQSNGLAVSRFRAAQVLFVNDAGEVEERITPVNGIDQDDGTRAVVMWRMRGLLNNNLIIVNQGATNEDGVEVESPGGYGGSDCHTGISRTYVTHIDEERQSQSSHLPGTSVVVDISPDQEEPILAAPGQKMSLLGTFSSGDNCGFIDVLSNPGFQISAVAQDSNGSQWAFSREPAALLLFDRNNFVTSPVVQFGGRSVFDTGHDLFHADTGQGIACASCHPEGGDDAVTWEFDGIGPRRTPSLRGSLRDTEPFHWDGDMRDFAMLTEEVMGVRMGGPDLPEQYNSAFFDWIDSIPLVETTTPAIDHDAADRGRAIFEDNTVGCAKCHAGERLSDNKSYDVGTGGTFQVPSLRKLNQRLPIMHNGCADTLAARFDENCGGGDEHGRTTQLSPNEVSDLTTYLETL